MSKKKSRWSPRKAALPEIARTEPEALATGSDQVAQTLVCEEQPVVPPISEAKLIANHANAQLSTGPTSPEGKAIVSQNATKHGLTGKFQVLPDESQADFDRLLGGLIRSEQPADDAEALMVQQMAEALWLSNRCVRLQNECFAALVSGTPSSAKGADARCQRGEEHLQLSGGALETAPVLRGYSQEQRMAHKQLALLMRYQTTHDRTFTRYSTELRKRRNERRRAERGFVSQKAHEAQQERRATAEKRKQELHELKVFIQQARLERIQKGRKLVNTVPEALTASDNVTAMAA